MGIYGGKVLLEMEEYSTKLTKKQIQKYLKDFSDKYGKSEYQISFKAALVLYDIFDKCNDIDISGTDKLGKILISSGKYEVMKAPRSDSNKIIINDRVEFFDGKTLKEIKSTSNIIDGYYVIKPEVLLKIYEGYNREKDQETIKRIKEYLKKEK